jgi:enoyl-CoA hydratase/carnithine racemase
VVSARGKHFTAGIDLQYAAGQFAPPTDPGRGAEARLRHIRWLQDSFNAVAECRAPVIAAIHGGCIGAGVDFASACDLRVASADAYLQVAEVDVAITADLGTLQRLTHLIPEGVVRDLTYTGRRMDAEEAARLSLVNRLLPSRDEAIAAGLEIARTIAAKSPLAVAGAKLSLNYSRGRPVEDGPASGRHVECGDAWHHRPHGRRRGPALAHHPRLPAARSVANGLKIRARGCNGPAQRRGLCPRRTSFLGFFGSGAPPWGAGRF